MKYIFIIALLILGSAASAADLCKKEVSAKVIKSIKSDSQINYFIRPSGPTDEVSFSTINGNRLLDLNSGETTLLSGEIDPVLSPDGQLIAIPEIMVFRAGTQKIATPLELPDDYEMANIRYKVMNGVVYEKKLGNTFEATNMKMSELTKKGVDYQVGVMAFYSRDEIKKRNFKPLLADTKAANSYQSLGVLSSTPEKSKYRLLFEGDDGIFTRDYYRDGKSGKMETASDLQPVCANIKKEPAEWTLPMISKDGTEFSVYDVNEEKSRVYKIDSNRNCKMVEEIPGLVGKMDFSPDHRYLAFHIDEGSDTKIFKIPESKDQFGVFLYDRQKKELFPVQVRKNEDSYYPVFLDNQRLAFISNKKKSDEFFINVASLGDQNADKSCSTKPAAGKSSLPAPGTR